jgi:hypothetical protein
MSLTELIRKQENDEKFDKNQASKDIRKNLRIMLTGDRRNRTFSQWRKLFSQLVTQYIEAYQYSSFTTYNKEPTGRGEGDALMKLRKWDESDELLDPKKVYEAAEKLIEENGVKDAEEKKKGYLEWF